MSTFIKLIDEATPMPQLPQQTGGSATSNIKPGEEKAPKPAVKKGGMARKLASGALKAANTIEKIGTGDWSVTDVLQGMLDKQLDKSTNKLGLFGKGPKYNQVKLGDDIMQQINRYNLDETTAKEAFQSEFVSLVEGMKNKKGQFKPSAKITREQLVLKLLQKVVDPATKLKVDDPDTGKPKANRRITMISKNVGGFLKTVKEVFPQVQFTYGRDDTPAPTAPTEDEEMLSQDISKSDWIKSLGADKVGEIVKGLAKIYPRERIEFNKNFNNVAENDSFELTKPLGYGSAGTQYTLKPLSEAQSAAMTNKGIKYITYLLKTPQNEYKLPETNAGIIYVYDTDDQIINDLTSNANFQWDGQDGVYLLSGQNEILQGVKYSEGQFPVSKEDAEISDDKKHIFITDPKSKTVSKMPVIRFLPTTNQYLVDASKAMEATPDELTHIDNKQQIKDGKTAEGGAKTTKTLNKVTSSVDSPKKSKTTPSKPKKSSPKQKGGDDFAFPSIS